jgi:hypothetical protein
MKTVTIEQADNQCPWMVKVNKEEIHCVWTLWSHSVYVTLHVIKFYSVNKKKNKILWQLINIQTKNKRKMHILFQCKSRLHSGTIRVSHLFCPQVPVVVFTEFFLECSNGRCIFIDFLVPVNWLWCLTPFNFIGGGNQGTWRKSPICHKSLTNFIRVLRFSPPIKRI